MNQRVTRPVAPILKSLADVVSVNWAELDDRRALRCLPGIALPLIVGAALHNTTAGLLGAAGAVSVGFGTVQTIYGSKLTPLVLASVCTPLSALIGMFVGAGDPAIIGVATVWGFVCGMATALGQGAVYVGVQAVVFLMVATAFPGKLQIASEVAGALFGGALLQTVIISTMRLVWGVVTRTPRTLNTRGIRRGASLAAHTVRRVARRRSTAYRHAIRVAGAMGISTAIARAIHGSHSYWMPMTTVMIIQPGLDQTVSRAVSRIVGTMFGVGAATAIAAEVRPNIAETMALVVLFAWLSYSFLRVNYLVAATCITAYVVFLLSFAGLPAVSVVYARVEFTALGAAVALVVYAAPVRPLRRVRA